MLIDPECHDVYLGLATYSTLDTPGLALLGTLEGEGGRVQEGDGGSAGVGGVQGDGGEVHAGGRGGGRLEHRESENFTETRQSGEYLIWFINSRQFLVKVKSKVH